MLKKSKSNAGKKPSKKIKIELVEDIDDDEEAPVKEYKEIEIAETFYNITCFAKGSIIVCQNREQLITQVISVCDRQENSIIRTKKHFNGRSCRFVCYFSITRKYDKFPSITPESLCPFKMVWNGRKREDGQYEFYCRSINPYHNHPRPNDNDCKSFESHTVLPEFVKEEIGQFYQQGFSRSEIFNAIQQSYPSLKMSSKVLRSCLSSRTGLWKSRMNYDDIVKRNIAEDGIILINNPKKQRIFITTKEKLALWNSLKDILLIETNGKLHPFFKASMLMLTVDRNGINSIIAIALLKEDNEENYDWTFNLFKNQGFTEPQTIITDSIKTQYDSMKENFPNSTILFSLQHYAHSCNLGIGRKGPFITYKLINVFRAETEEDLLTVWNNLLSEYPSLQNCEEYLDFFNYRDQWAKYSVWNFFTAGLLTRKRSKSMFTIKKEINKVIEREGKLKMFSQYENLCKADEETSSVKHISVKKIGALEDVAANVKGIEKLYTQYCLLRVYVALKCLWQIFPRTNLDDEIIIVDDRSWRVSKLFEIHWEYRLCTCKRMIKHGIPCSHLLFMCRRKNKNIVEFIIEHTAKRWLLPEHDGKTDKELLGIAIKFK
ncbi:unnamed protein product [Blepharisma stoltei]|uniref:SWIM-type domain-containing protein n=1 Tax=Blepharisma stoltei TaxID=1481888 RepID=A0AAU9JTL9_9CILI|nr:unnamed protein product [Blepharisma stoltei]